MMIILLILPFMTTQTLYLSNVSSLRRLLKHPNDDLTSLEARKWAFCDVSEFSNIFDDSAYLHSAAYDKIA